MRARCSVLFVLLPTLLCVVAAGTRAGIVTGTIQVEGGGTFLPLAVGTPAFGPTDRYVWSTIPDLLSSNGFSFWQTNPGPGWPSVPYGKITFNVTQSGPVYMAVTTRFGGGGNSSGGWIPELTSEAQLIAQGWHQVATGLSDVDSLSGNTDVDFLIFERDSVAGESFTYRTEKYIPPIPLTTQAIPPPP
ncbi:MAG: hypothetical protein K2Y37_18940 [Pirellulales bacterium]|nr:hypothetical protein [Pirellulales bacterium]